MTERIERQLQLFVRDKAHHAWRVPGPAQHSFAAEYATAGLPPQLRAADRLRRMLALETPVVLPDERITLTRTVRTVQEIFTPGEWEAIRAGHRIHEQGKVCNVNPDYAKLLAVGTDACRADLSSRLDSRDPEGEEGTFLRSALTVLDGLEDIADRYARAAREAGNAAVAENFTVVPRRPPQSFQQALQFLRLLHFGLWVSGNYHNTLGRVDQYLYPYYKQDVDAGRLDDEGALELIEEFFLSCNRDSDLYPGMQQGDNGQSLVLGGRNADGTDSYNELSALCLRASLELKLIDPKINLRVSGDTPLERYREATALTRQGLGFPQYSNDDVVIPALLAWGYAPQDAYNYVVAACWEFIVPGAGMDIPNIDALSFVAALNAAMPRLAACGDFAAFLSAVKEEITAQAGRLMAGTAGLTMEPAPLLSLLMDGCVERGRDISLGGTYNNYGLHGTGLATAVDSLSAIRRYVYEEGSVTAEGLLAALADDFEGAPELLHRCRFDAPKMGCDDPATDALAVELLDCFADALEGRRNDRGGVFRAGTGSAMYYLWHAGEQPATADGRRRGEPLACNYSPSLFARVDGPVSVLKSFTRPHLQRVANGGPLTIELHDSLFRGPDSTDKVAAFVKSFFALGGHQMQLNAVNRDLLLRARERPQEHRNLIVRVWGWSGYFVELDPVYQDHILRRTEFLL